MAKKYGKGGKYGETKEINKPEEVKNEKEELGIFARILEALRNLWAKIVALFARIF